ncbi:unnamed protein product [Candidula unifasciata]|uniref:Carboxylic ester hydrolase n=1 Tax=Candidula unifasciata TaxID=100452 RepID=A0A8S3ZR73_9EUPU|nr:unnamed protein product [Candidula unifasciata]
MPLLHQLSTILVAAALYCASARSSDPEIRTPAGTFRGKVLTSHSGYEFESYRGIPYALPPTGQRRFALPVRHPVIGHKDGTVIGQEDCLFLNVFRPLRSQVESEDAELKKVFVFIHGGGFVVGASDPYLPGDLVTRGDLIVVTMNYRLNWFGFLRGNSGYLPGNQGFWDQLLSLQWIRDNIRSFGGDPDDVTISGESAGSLSTSLLSVSPLAKGLFTKAVLLSGTTEILPTSPHTSNDYLQKASNKYGCGSGSVDGNEEAVVRCLKQLPAETFVTDFGFDPTISATSSGDDLLPKPFAEILNDTDFLSEVGFYNRDYIVSITADDGDIMTSARFGVIDVTSQKHSLEGLSPWLGLPSRVAELVLNEYQNIYGDLKKSVTALTTDITFLKASVSFVETYTRQPRKQSNPDKNAYLMSFDHSPRYVPDQYMLHALDLAYLFDLNTKEFIENFYYIELEDKFYEEDIQLKADYIDLIAAFIKTGNPNKYLTEQKNVVWSPFDPETKGYLSFSLQPSVKKDILGNRRVIWETLLPRWLQEQQQSGAREDL